MTKEKRVKEKIVYEPVSRMPSEYLALLRVLGEFANSVYFSHKESELPVIA
jgi:hypothetical protein